MNKLESKSGFVNILGVPNSGKSTLINKLVGKNVSIVSHKVQTTRFCIRGICTYLFEDLSKSQIILIDTPGIFSAKRRLDKAMVSAAWSELKHSDKVIFIHDVSKSIENNSLNYLGSPKWSDLSIYGSKNISSNIILRLGLTNVFDYHYRTFASGISSPGRSVEIGINIEL